MSEVEIGKDLLRIRGVGPATAIKLAEKGIDTVEKLIVAKPEEVSSILNISLARAKELINRAKETALERVIEVWTAKKMREYLDKNVEYIPTGIEKLDKFLGRGFRTESIYTISGSSAAGKSEIGYSLLVNCIRYLKRPVVFIETEPATLNLDRILQIAGKRGVEIDEEKDLFIIPARFITDPHRQLLAYELIDKWAGGVERKPGLIIIDGFVSKIREYYVGRETLSARAQEIARHIGMLQLLSSKYNCCIYLTEQVYAVPDTTLQLETLKRFGDTRRPYGGEYLLHSTSAHMTVIRVKTDVWAIITDDVPGKPMETIYFTITDRGVEDYKNGV